jgi:hypothetical protein
MLLQVYVSENCWGCQEARKIAYETRVKYPELRIDLIARESAQDWPDQVIATPAYILNGKLISLGNPTRERLHSLIVTASDEVSPEAD